MQNHEVGRCGGKLRQFKNSEWNGKVIGYCRGGLDSRSDELMTPPRGGHKRLRAWRENEIKSCTCQVALIWPSVDGPPLNRSQLSRIGRHWMKIIYDLNQDTFMHFSDTNSALPIGSKHTKNWKTTGKIFISRFYSSRITRKWNWAFVSLYLPITVDLTDQLGLAGASLAH